MKTDLLLGRVREGGELTKKEQLLLPLLLSLPAMLAQVSSIVMQYIDASMVGSLGASASAAIGLISSSTWLFNGVTTAAASGFTVQVAYQIGAGKPKNAREVMKLGFLVALGLSAISAAVGAGISGALPGWLGGEQGIRADASGYFLVFVLSLPIVQLNAVASGMLQCSGNMRVPGLLHVLMCLLDVVFNLLLIFPTRAVTVLGLTFTMPGAGLGVVGAALGSALSEAVIALVMVCFLLLRCPALKIRRGERLPLRAAYLKRAVKISLPIAFESAVMCGAQVMATRIVSPLGTISIAANSFAVTAESLCYMPGYGIGSAATTLIGQSIGAGREKLARRLAWSTTGIGVLVMTVTGTLMFFAAPLMIGLLSPDPEICALGTAVLRIEAFAEPFYAASIVASGALRGAGDTLIPSGMSLVSMWAVRLPVAAMLAPVLGLRGVWIAMCAELCVRGILFLLRLRSRRWSDPGKAQARHARRRT